MAMLNRMKQYVSSKSMSIYSMMIPERSDLREIKKRVDFDFIYDIVSPFYSEFEGRRSYDPMRLIKMEYLKIRYKISGDNELLAEIQDRASFREFLGIELTEALPDRTTLVNFRTQIGIKIMDEIFETIVEMCKKEDMVGGKHSVFDGTNTKADARIVATRDKIYKEENVKKNQF
jgi:transposase